MALCRTEWWAGPFLGLVAALSRNTLPSIVAAVDDSFFLGGALKDSKLVQDQMLQGEPPGRGSRGRLGGASFNAFTSLYIYIQVDKKV